VSTELDRFAIFGGAPAFAEARHVGRPNVGDRRALHARIDGLLDRRWLSNDGPLVREFEQAICDLTGTAHCVAVCNATVALEILIRALGLAGEVIVPSFTFVATAHALQWLGLTPVFCDVDPITHNIDPAQVERLITPRTAAVLGVHVWGRPCDVDRLSAIAHDHAIPLLFDAAHAFGCSYRGGSVGTFGAAEVFSFHATKVLNTFEGGAVVTNNGALADRLRLMRNFGFAGYDRVVEVGTNGKMPEVCAAMGLTGLESFETFVAVNRRNYREYASRLACIPGVRLVTYDETERCNFQYVVAEIDADVTHIGRDPLVDVLFAENILARRYFHPGCHRMEPYRSLPRYADADLPETERLSDRVLCLPNGTDVTSEDAGRIADVLRGAVAHGAEISARLAAR